MAFGQGVSIFHVSSSSIVCIRRGNRVKELVVGVLGIVIVVLFVARANDTTFNGHVGTA